MNRRLVPWWRSLRVLIAIGVAVVSVVVSGVVGLTLAQQAATAARESLRDQVLGRLATAADGYVIDGRLRGGATLDPTSPPPALVSDLGDGRRATLYDGQWMWAATRIDATNVITVRLDASSLHEQDAVRIRTLAVALGLALVASAGLGWGVGSTLSGRVRRAVRTVHAVERGEQGVRVHSGGNDEVAVLTASVDAMADALALEQAFTADVAHELRTPLTALVTASELLPDDPASDLTRSQVARMRRLVEDLLTLSRLDAAVEESARETIDLAHAAREALSLAAPTVPDARVTCAWSRASRSNSTSAAWSTSCATCSATWSGTAAARASWWCPGRGCRCSMTAPATPTRCWRLGRNASTASGEPRGRDWG